MHCFASFRSSLPSSEVQLASGNFIANFIALIHGIGFYRGTQRHEVG